MRAAKPKFPDELARFHRGEAVKSSIAKPRTRTCRARVQTRAVTTGHSRASSSSIHSDSRSAAVRSQERNHHYLPRPFGDPVPNFAEPAAFSQAPCGELNENKRGSSSSKARPQLGQLISVLMTSAGSLHRAGALCPTDLDRALSQVARFQNSLRVNCVATTSIVCSLKRSSFRKCETGISFPST